MSEKNQTINFTPVRTVTKLPKTHERIIVPVEPIVRDVKQSKVEVVTTQRPVTTTYPTTVESRVRKTTIQRFPPDPTDTPKRNESTKRQAKRKAYDPSSYDPASYDDLKGNYRIIHNYKDRPFDELFDDEHNTIQPIQPLHINTKVFRRRRAKNTPTPKPSKKNKNRLKLENLPPNPTVVPETTWFDNTGKFSYGILHEDDDSFTEPTAYSRKHEKKVQASPEDISVEKEPHDVEGFRSKFREQRLAPLTQANGLGNFLYKSEIHYPSYSKHLYPPVLPYGVQPIQIVHPVPIEPIHNLHPAAVQPPVETIYPVVTTVHHPPLIHHPQLVHHPQPVHHAQPVPQPVQHSKTKNQPKPGPPAKPAVYNTEVKHSSDEEEAPPSKPLKKKPPPPAETSDDEPAPKKEKPQKPVEEHLIKESAKQELPDNAEEEYDEQEGDEYEGDEEGDDEEEEEESDEEEKPRYSSELYKRRYDRPNEKPFGKSLELDQFDRAWAKYGYGRSNDPPSSDEESGSAESSETRVVPRRIKYYHEKKENVTTPFNISSGKPRKEMVQVVSGALNNSKPKKSGNKKATTQASMIHTATTEPSIRKQIDRPNKSLEPRKIPQNNPKGVKSQQDEMQKRSDASGSDDLKYFQ